MLYTSSVPVLLHGCSSSSTFKNSCPTAYKVLALVMLFIGGIAAYTFVWDLGDVGIGLMTIFNIIALYPLAGEALSELKSYEESKKL